MAGKQCKVICPVPVKGFDPTEVAVPWMILAGKMGADEKKETGEESKISVQFATPDGAKGPPAAADPIMVDGKGLYLLKWNMRADANGRQAYQELLESGSLASENLVAYADLSVEDYDAMLLPGGHCPDMRPYLEDKVLQKFVSDFAATKKPIGAICHGVVLCARSGILKEKTVTALPNFMENVAVGLTWLWMGDYYRTYKGTTVEKEVREHCKEFQVGPKGFGRDSMKNLKPGFCCVDGTLITGRWPGDAHTFGLRLRELVEQSK